MCSFSVPRGADFIRSYVFPEGTDFTGYSASFKVYASLGGSTLLNITGTPSGSDSVVTFAANVVTLTITPADIATLAVATDPTEPKLLQFDFFLTDAEDITSKIQGGLFKVYPFGSSVSDSSEDITVNLGGSDVDVTVYAGPSFDVTATVSDLGAELIATETASAMRELLGVPAFTFIPVTGSENSAAIQAAVNAAGTGATIVFEDGTHIASPGVLSMLSGQHWTCLSPGSATIQVSGPLSSNAQLVKANFKTDCTISNLTFDGAATLLLNRVTAMSGALTVSVVSGKQYKVAMRADLAATLTMSGPVTFASPSTTLVMTGTGMSPGSTVVYGYFTATADGTMTLTRSGTVNYVSVMENGGPVSGLVNAFDTDGFVLSRVKVDNFDSLGIATNACDNVDILAHVERSGASWDQNLAILCSNSGGDHGKTLIRCGTRLINSGGSSECDGLVVEDGVAVSNVGYSSCWTTLVGSTNSRIGKVLISGNASWADMDDTCPNGHELYGSGELIAPKINGNPGNGLYICGPWRVVCPEVYDTGSYWIANGVLTQHGIQFGYLDASTNSAGAVVISPVCGDTRSGTDRTQCYGMGDQSSSVFGTTVLDGKMINNRVGRYDFLGTISRVFRGLRSTFGKTITSTGSLAAGRSYSEDVTATGTTAESRVVGFAIESGTLSGLVPVQPFAKADAVTVSFINGTSGSATGSSIVVTVEVEEAPTA